MPRGHPDWDVDVDAEMTVTVDNNELAVRLGSPYRISRTGNIFYSTDFINDLNLWTTSKLTSGGTISIDKTKGVFSLGSLKFQHTGASNQVLTLTNRLPYIRGNKWGLETVVWFDTNNVRFTAKLSLCDGSNLYEYAYAIDSNDESVKLLDSDNAYDTVQTITITPITSDDKWIHLKGIFDSNTHLYDKMIINQNSLTDVVQTPRVTSLADLPFSKIELSVDNSANTTFIFRLGFCILTVNEP